MKTITIEEYARNEEKIRERVESGEKIAITDWKVSVVLTPSDEYVRMHTTGGSAESWWKRLIYYFLPLFIEII